MKRIVRSLILPALVGSFVSACATAADTAGAAAGGEGPPAGAPLLYASVQDEAKVAVLDMETLEVVETVDLTGLGFSVNARPHHVVVEPDGSHWYVSLIGANTVLKMDRRNRIVGRAEFEVPGMLALHPTEDVLYVGRSMMAVSPPRRIGVIDKETMEVDEIDVFIPRPHAVAVGPDGEIVYTASLAENRMAAVWPEDEEIELFGLPAHGGHPHTLVQFAVSPDGRTMVGTGEMTAQLLVFDLRDPAAPALGTSLDVGARPWHPIFTPDGRWLFFANKGTDAVTVVDARSWTVVDVITGQGLDDPHGSAVSPDGRTVFISSNGSDGRPGSVVAIDVATRRIVAVLPLGMNVTGLGGPARF